MTLSKLLATGQRFSHLICITLNVSQLFYTFLAFSAFLSLTQFLWESVTPLEDKLKRLCTLFPSRYNTYFFYQHMVSVKLILYQHSDLTLHLNVLQSIFFDEIVLYVLQSGLWPWTHYIELTELFKN